MTKNNLVNLPTKKIKIAAHSKRKYKTKSSLDDAMHTLTDLMNKCSFNEPHYGIIYIILDEAKMATNYRNNLHCRDIAPLYLLITRFLSLTIDIHVGSGPEFYNIIDDPNQLDDVQSIQISSQLTIYLVYLHKKEPVLSLYRWIPFIDFYNHYIESYEYEHIYPVKVINNAMDNNPYRAIIRNHMGRKGHIKSGAFKMKKDGNGEVLGEVKMSMVYDKIVEFVDNKNLK